MVAKEIDHSLTRSVFSQPDDVTGGLIWRRYQLFSAADNSIAKETEGSPEEKIRIQT